MAAGTLTLQLPNKTKDVHWIVDGPQGSVAVLLAHGAGGDAASGNLPALTGALAAAGFPVLRFTCRGGNLEHRVAVTKVVDLLPAQAALLPASQCRNRCSTAVSSHPPAGTAEGGLWAAGPGARAALGDGRPQHGRASGLRRGCFPAAGGASGSRAAVELSPAPPWQASAAAGCAAARPARARSAAGARQQGPLQPAGAVGCSGAGHPCRLQGAAAHCGRRRPQPVHRRRRRRGRQRGSAAGCDGCGSAVFEGGGGGGRPEGSTSTSSTSTAHGREAANFKEGWEAQASQRACASIWAHAPVVTVPPRNACR